MKTNSKQKNTDRIKGKLEAKKLNRAGHVTGETSSDKRNEKRSKRSMDA